MHEVYLRMKGFIGICVLIKCEKGIFKPAHEILVNTRQSIRCSRTQSLDGN